MLTFQQLILALNQYWDRHGCVLLQPYDMEVGAGTSHTATFLRAIVTHDVPGRSGETPYVRWGNYAVLALCALLVATAFGAARARRTR